jgi:hypothetical protein
MCVTYLKYLDVTGRTLQIVDLSVVSLQNQRAVYCEFRYIYTRTVIDSIGFSSYRIPDDGQSPETQY